MAKSMYDILSGDDEPEIRPRSAGKWNSGRKSNPQRATPPRRTERTKPAEVSDRMWGLTEEFFEQGKAFFGRDLPINKEDFSRRLSDVVNTDEAVVSMLRPKDWNGDRTRLVVQQLTEDQLEDRLLRINDVISEMIKLFWGSQQVGTQRRAAIQFDFLHDRWDELWYRAEQNLQLASLTKALSDGTASRKPQVFKLQAPEKAAERRLQRLQRKLRKQAEETPREPLTEEARKNFTEWLADRKH